MTRLPSPRHRFETDEDPALPAWAARYRAVRLDSERLCLPLCIEDFVIQTTDEASPAKWHLAHVSWFFETFILNEYLPGYACYDKRYRMLFNSYYEQIGEFHPRPARGFLSRPTVDEVYRYRTHVDQHMLALLDDPRDRPWHEILERLEIGLHHEQQHQELLLTDIKRNFSVNPLRPAYRVDLPTPPVGPRPALEWLDYEGGLVDTGHHGPGFCFDNELPRHRVFLNPFRFASRLVTNGEYLAFMEAGGYRNPALWLSDGWAQVQKHGWRSPLYWERIGGEWWQYTLAGLRRLAPDEPVCHISHYEAEAYASWVGRRLPTEDEWEHAACASLCSPTDEGVADHGGSGGAGAERGDTDLGVRHDDEEPPPAAAWPNGNLRNSGYLQPVVAPAAAGPVQLFGDVWEHTRSAYLPYPGFRPAAGALGEYNGKFMSGQMVLRGGSCVTPDDHIRPSYRNFFYPHERWQFQGLRLAGDPD